MLTMKAWQKMRMIILESDLHQLLVWIKVNSKAEHYLTVSSAP
jgi:hypothetical protein